MQLRCACCVWLHFIITLASLLAYADTKTPLPSWNDAGTAKKQILAFVKAVTDHESGSFARQEERIAVFDNDGTLWAEQPMYFQLALLLTALRRLRRIPEWKTKQPFKGVLENDLKSVLAGGEHAILELVMATHAGNTTDEFERSSRTACDSQTSEDPKLYTEMVYQPMIAGSRPLRMGMASRPSSSLGRWHLRVHEAVDGVSTDRRGRHWLKHQDKV